MSGMIGNMRNKLKDFKNLHFFNRLLKKLRQTLNDPLRRFQLSLLTLLALTLFGTWMYMLLENWSFFEALYMTVITIATVGFGEVRELSETGRAFTIILILLGVGAATTAISNAVSLALGPVLWSSLNQRRMLDMISQMENHYIVCGYGRTGKQIVRDLQARDEPFVLVDKQVDEEQMREDGILYIEGDATRDEVLLQAGVEQARGVVAALNSDASNVMTVLTARGLNPAVFIVARVVHVESESKLRRAGANEVVNPYQIGGHRMALSLLRPVVHDFMDRLFHLGDDENVDIGQLIVHNESRLQGQTIGNIDLRGAHNVNILAIRSSDGQLAITPPPSRKLELHDVLIVIGPPASIYQLERENIREASD